MAHARGRLSAAPHAARSLVKSFAADTSGATAIEYALIGGLIALVIIASLTTIGTRVNTMIVSAANGFH